MALKAPPPPWEILQQGSELVGGSSVKQEVDKNMREEFDAQAEVLQRTRSRVVELEASLEELTRELESLTSAK